MFAGIIARASSTCPPDYASVQTVLDALTPYKQADQSGSWESEQALIVQALTWNTPGSKRETTPYQCPHSQLVIASWLRLDNQAALMDALEIDQPERVTGPMLVVAAYRKWGKACADKLEGDFSFVIYDPAKHVCFAARDSIGIKPFYYYLDDQVFIFSTTAALFPQLTHFRLRPNLTWTALNVGDASSGVSMSLTETGFENVVKLPPAHCLTLNPDTIDLRRYFTFRDDPPVSYQRDDKWVTAYREQLNEAVKARVQSDYLVGAESSGGIDSSTITALAALNLPHDKKHFHLFGFSVFEQEAAYILETSQFHDIPHNHIYTKLNPEEEPDALFEREMKVLGYPCEQGNALGHTMFYRLCEQFGIRTLLSGYGGDEVVTNKGDLLVRELIDAGRYGKLFQEMPGNLLTRLLRTGKRIYQSGSTAQMSNVEKLYRQRLTQSLINPEAEQQFQFREKYLKAVRHDGGYRHINEFILANCSSPFIPTRTENCTLMAASFRVDYRWPLLDRRLIQQYLSTPSIEKFSWRANRYLHRRAVEDVVPAKVIWKPSKDLGDYVEKYVDPNAKAKAKALDNPVLNSLESMSLHEYLAPLVHQKRLKQQMNIVKTELTQQKFDRQNPIPRINCYTVYMLNRWLNYYFN